MPVLKEYADSNDKDGYYVHAYVSGLSHPLPLQAPEVTEEIYRELGYKPIKPGDDGGVNVPKHLTWTLFEVGLHWTEKSGPQGEPSDFDSDDLREVAGPDLTDEDIETIVEFAKDYRGQYQSRVKDLQDEFTGKESGTMESSDDTSLQELLAAISTETAFDKEVEELFEKWEPESIKPDDYNPDEDDGFFSQYYTTRSEYREELSSVPNLKTRLQEYEDHPWNVQKVSAVSRNLEGDSNGLSVSFQTEAYTQLSGWCCTDYRGTEETKDFKISTGVSSSRNYTFEVTDNYISDFDMGISHQSVGKFDIPPADFWGYEVENQDPNEMIHTLAIDFHHLIPIIEEFFDRHPSYDLESTKPGDHSVYLP